MPKSIIKKSILEKTVFKLKARIIRLLRNLWANSCVYYPIIRYRKSKKILIVLRPDLLGDFVLFTQSFQFYRELYPKNEWKIVLVGNPVFRELAFIWNTMILKEPAFDSFIDYDSFKERKEERVYSVLRFPYKLSKTFCRIILKIRRQAPDAIICPIHHIFRAFEFDIIVHFSGAQTRIAPKGDTIYNAWSPNKITADWYTKLIPDNKSVSLEIEKNISFTKALGINYKIDPVPSWDVSKIREDISIPEELVKKYPELSKEFCLMAPATSREFRMLPKEKFGEIVKVIKNKYNLYPVFLGAPGEKNICAEVAEQSEIEAVNLCGEVSFLEIVSLMERARFFIGMDSGLTHLACAAGTPTLCILGGGHYGRFFPYGDNIFVTNKLKCFGCYWQCTNQDKYSCIKYISVSSILEGVDRIISVGREGF